MNTSASQASKPTLHRISYSHDAMIDMIIAEPRLTNAQLAAHFGVSESWMSTIKASDAWKSRLAARRAELVDPLLIETIETRYKAVAAKAVEVLLEKLHKPQVSDTLALRAAELGAKVGGYGAMAPQPPADALRLESLAERLIALQNQVRKDQNVQAIEVEAREVAAEQVRESGGAEGPGPVRDEPPQGTVRADAGGPCEAACPDGGSSVGYGCSRCGKPVCECDVDF